MKPIHLYFRTLPQKNRLIPGDRHLISLYKKFFRTQKISGVRKVFLNLCKGFDQLNIAYDINLPFKKIKPGEPVIVLGEGRYALEGYDRPNPVIAGIALMSHPSEWPDLFEHYPVATYLQHSEWARDMYANTYPKEKCRIWPAGIETGKWAPSADADKKFDILIYNKIRWNNADLDQALRLPVIKYLETNGLTYNEIVYGSYHEPEYMELLKQSRAMIFLCEHESQGFACCEALSMDVPVLAWDQGFCLDPNLVALWGEKYPVPATSVPFFDETCGMRFIDLDDFEKKLNVFWTMVMQKAFTPRKYILSNLTLEKSTEIMLDIVNRFYK